MSVNLLPNDSLSLVYLNYYPNRNRVKRWLLWCCILNLRKAKKSKYQVLRNWKTNAIKPVPNHTTFTLYNAYIPPNSFAETYQCHLSTMHKIALDPDDVVIIIGDFNLPKVDWSVDTDYHDVLFSSAFEPTYIIHSLLILSWVLWTWECTR